MNESASHSAPRPRFLWASFIASALLVPGLMLVDWLAANGGDGLAGFWAGVTVVFCTALASLACMIAGLVRGERPRWSALLVLVLLWCALIQWLAF